MDVRIDPGRRVRPGKRVGIAGFLATAVAYGPARMGFGLFLPDLRRDLGISSTFAGAVSSAAFIAFLLAIPAAAWATRKWGVRVPVVAGLASAAAGMACVALAPGPEVLAAGVVLAGASPGLCWSPFNDAATALLSADWRPRVLSVVSTGTTLGIAAAAAAALAGVLVGVSWRWSWAAFAVAAVVAGLVGLLLLPARSETAPAEPTSTGPDSGATVAQRARALLQGLTWPLVTAFSFGATSAIYLAFAADAVARAGAVAGLPAAAAGTVIYLAFGVCGMVGLFSADLHRWLGLVGFLVAIFAAATVSTALLAMKKGELEAVLVSAGLQGICVMTMSAVLSYWTTSLRPASASTSFAVVLGALALGGVVGPVTAGVFLDDVGGRVVFGATSVVSLLTGVAVLAASRTISRSGDPDQAAQESSNQDSSNQGSSNEDLSNQQS